jgi:hypothetical protein
MSAREYSIGFVSQQGLLRAHVQGTASLENTIAYWTEIVARIRLLQPHSLLLIDELAGTALGAEEWFGLVQAMGGQGLESVRIAHVKPHGLERIEYCEIYAKEAGFDARVFDDIATAELWLRHGEREGGSRRAKPRRSDVAETGRPRLRRG